MYVYIYKQSLYKAILLLITLLYIRKLRIHLVVIRTHLYGILLLHNCLSQGLLLLEQELVTTKVILLCNVNYTALYLWTNSGNQIALLTPFHTSLQCEYTLQCLRLRLGLDAV